MKRLFGIVAVVLLAMIVWRQWDGIASQEPEPPAAKPAPGVKLKMTTATWGGLRFPVPEAWKSNVRYYGKGQVLFDGPRDKGAPVLSAFWTVSDRTIEDLAQHWTDKYDNPGSLARILERGWTTVGGRRAYVMVYELKPPGVSNELAAGTHIQIDWYVQTRGHVGFVRGTCERAFFPIDYRPLFEAIAAQTKYGPG